MNRFLLTGIVLAMAIGSAEAAEVTFATDIANPPYSQADASGSITGFERDFGDAVCTYSQHTCTWVAKPRGELIPGLIAGAWDAVIAALPIDGDFGPDVTTTQAYLYPNVYGIAGIGGNELVFGTGTVAAARDDPQIEALANWAKESGRILVPTENLEEALNAVLTGQVDAAIAPKADLAGAVSTSGGELAFVYQDQKFESGLAIAVGQDNADLRFSFEDAIYDMGQDGSLAALASKWFGETALTGVVGN